MLAFQCDFERSEHFRVEHFWVQLSCQPVDQSYAKYGGLEWLPDPAKMEMNLENAFKSCPDPSPLLSAPVRTEIAVEEISHDLIITIPETNGCRICEPDDEDENGQGLVELGCKCKGEMSRMHRTCFLEWFGTRMLLEDNYDCEVCNSMLPFETQMVMAEAVGDHVSGGRKVLLKGLKRHLGLREFALSERAVNYEELVQVLLARNAPVLSQETAIDVEMQAQEDQYEQFEEQSRRMILVTLGVFGVLAIGAVAFSYITSLVAGFPSTFMY